MLALEQKKKFAPLYNLSTPKQMSSLLQCKKQIYK